MGNAVFPQLSLADLARIWKTGGQAVADLAAQHGVSKRAICRGVWYARNLGDPQMKAMAGDAAATVARTGLNFAARTASTTAATTAAGVAGEATLVGTLGTLAAVAFVIVMAVKAFYPYSIRGRAEAGEFPWQKSEVKESEWNQFQVDFNKEISARSRAARSSDENDARLRRARESARRHDRQRRQSIESGPGEELDDFDEELRRTSTSPFR